MAWVLVFAVIIWVAFVLLRRSDAATDTTTAAPSGAPKAISSEIQDALEALGKLCDTCKAAHDDAFHALVFIAASDGKVSRQEFRIILGFCERMGSDLGGRWPEVVEKLNDGITISIDAREATISEHIEALRNRPVPYRAAFLGAVEAIVASNRTSNATKRRLLDQSRNLIA